MKTPTTSISNNQLKEQYCFLLGQPAEEIANAWLNEALNRRDAIAFIRQRGLLNDFTQFKETYSAGEFI